MADIDPGEYQQTIWVQANNGALGYMGQPGFGDIGFGTPDQGGPAVSFAAMLSGLTQCEACEIPWPANGMIFSLGLPATTFRISWGEAGAEHEGWYPWWSGRVFVR